MKRVGPLLCGVAVLAMATGLATEVYARALIAIPLQGQSAQQQENDRSDCGDYAAAVTGYSPSGLPIVVRAGPPGAVAGPVPTPPILVQTPQGPVVTSSAPPAAALDVLYANYLAAGAACLTARGYQVQMNVVPVQ
jgi:hypothetical protein